MLLILLSQVDMSLHQFSNTIYLRVLCYVLYCYSGMLVQGPSKAKDVDTIFNQARQAGGVEASAEPHVPSSSSRRFAGTGRLLSGEVSSTPAPTPQQPEIVNHNITFWRNGFTVDDGPLRRLDDPANASFLEVTTFGFCLS